MFTYFQNEKKTYKKDSGLIGYTIELNQNQVFTSPNNNSCYNQLVDIETQMPLSTFLVKDKEKIT